MKCYKTFLLCLFLFLTGPAGSQQKSAYNPDYLYPLKELKEDFVFLKTNFRKIHPDLYLYTPRARMDSFFDSLDNTLNKPLTGMGFYNLITLLYSKIMDGHSMFLPGRDAMDFFNRQCRFLPFNVVIKKDRLFITRNCSSDKEIWDGTEIMAINGVSTPDCLRALIKRQIRDGYNKTYPIWILSNYFKEYYGFLYGHPDRFTITCKNSRGIVENRVVSAISKDSIRVNGNLRYPRYFSKSPVNQGILLELDNPMFTGILTIKTFDRDILRSQYKQEFDVEFRKAFQLLEIHGIKRLVLDLRDNQGGDFGPGITLLSYLLKSPVQYLKGSKEQQLIQPLKNGFKGDLYILVNGGSFSSTAILCSYLEQTKRGTFIGEETAGNRNLISGDPMDLVLPNTHIVCSISTVRYRISERINDGHGIIPSQRIDCAVRDIISGRDPVKNFAMDLIVKKAAAD